MTPADLASVKLAHEQLGQVAATLAEMSPALGLGSAVESIGQAQESLTDALEYAEQGNCLGKALELLHRFAGDEPLVQEFIGQFGLNETPADSAESNNNAL